MGKLEEFTASCPDFAKARYAIEALGRLARSEWKRRTMRNGFDVPTQGCYRILTNPEEELSEWDKRGGYKAKESLWGRFVCTGNKHLPWMLNKGLVPPHLRDPQVMIEVQQWGIECLKYTHAALGAFPYKEPRGICMDATDMYVDTSDLVLAECFSYGDVGISKIQRIFLAPNAKPNVQAKTEAFAKAHNIPIERGFPTPEEDLEPIYEDLITYLKGRGKVCSDSFNPPRDVAAAALAEAYDQKMHYWTPVGASDAMNTMIEVGKRNYQLSPIFNMGNPPEGCTMPEIQTILEETKVEAIPIEES